MPGLDAKFLLLEGLYYKVNTVRIVFSFWRQIPVNEPDIAYNLDALPALKAQLEAVERGGAPTIIRQNRSDQEASTSVPGCNGHVNGWCFAM